MSLLEALVLGAVQGATEFVPISSTGHLILVPWFLGWEPRGLAFDAALHLGTLAALLLYFRSEWIALARDGLDLLTGRRRGRDHRLFGMIAAATVPGGLAGLLAEDLVAAYLRGPIVVASTLIGLAAVLMAAERMGRRTRGVDDLGWTDALAVGAAQALAIVPGVSRAGITITAALFRGLRRDAAARFSFLLSAPIIAGAAAKKLIDLAAAGIGADEAGMLGAGIASAAVVGYLAIAFMLKYLATHTTYLFIYYRIILGLVVLLAFQAGFR